MKERLKNILCNLVMAEKSPNKLTLSFCVGTFIAISPTIPLQTPLIFLLSWLFGLNTTVTFTSVYLINNPITMVPIYMADYFVGELILNKIMNLNVEQYNPSWVDKFSAFLNKYINLESYLGESVLCFWCLVIGGIILPLVVSLTLYFVLKPVFKKLIEQNGYLPENK